MADLHDITVTAELVDVRDLGNMDREPQLRVVARCAVCGGSLSMERMSLYNLVDAMTQHLRTNHG